MGYTGDKKREYQRRWVADRRAAFFDGKVCVECGSTKNLELDHIDPDKKVTHRIWSWSKIRQLEELAKCQVLCEKCHLRKTTGENSKTHCKNGHSLEDADRNADGSVKECRTCRTLRFRRSRAK